MLLVLMFTNDDNFSYCRLYIVSSLRNTLAASWRGRGRLFFHWSVALWLLWGALLCENTNTQHWLLLLLIKDHKICKSIVGNELFDAFLVDDVSSFTLFLCHFGTIFSLNHHASCPSCAWKNLAKIDRMITKS